MRELIKLFKTKIIFLLVLITGFLIFFQACSSISANKNLSMINITVENKSVRKIPAGTNFIGINWMNDGKINREIFTSPDNMNDLGKVLNNLSIDCIRFPNGNQVLTAFWDVPDSQIVKALNKIPNEDLRPVFSKTYTADDRLSFQKFMEFCRKFNIKATIQVNDHSVFDKENTKIIILKTFNRGAGNLPKYKKSVYETGKVNWALVNQAAKTAAAQVKWVKDNNYSDLVKFWEIGNEEFGKLGLDAAYTGEEYGKVASIFIKEMKQVDPSIKIIICNNFKLPVSKTSPRYKWNDIVTQWTQDIMKSKEIIAAKNDISFVSTHIGAVAMAQAGKEKLNINEEFLSILDDESKGRLKAHSEFLDKLGYPKTDIFVNEFNERATPKKTLTNHVWIGSLLNARVIMNMAAMPRCYHMDYHILFQHLSYDTAQYNNYGIGIVHFAKDFQKPFLLQPTAYTLKLFNENLKGTVLTASSDNDYVSVLPVIDGKKLKVLVLNIRQNKPVNISLKNFPALEYKENYSLGSDVPENFSIIDVGDSYDNPEQVRQLNILKDKISVTKKENSLYSVKPAQNTLSVFIFDIK